MAEEWREVPGYEGIYDVSSEGRVRSWKRYHTTGKWHLLRPSLDRRGYRHLTLHSDGKKIHRVHRLVLLAFVGPSDLDVCHGDGNRQNNRLSNLRYGTPAENQADRLAHGTAMCGDQMPQAKLTWKQIDYCRRVYIPRHPEFGGAALARRFGTTQPNMSLIVNKVNWKGDESAFRSKGLGAQS